MRLRVISDIHAHPFAYQSGADGQGRLRSIKAALAQSLVGVGAETTVLIPGDVFHQRGLLPTQAVYAVLDVLNTINPAQYLAVTGNHDDVGAPGGPTAMDALQAGCDNLRVLDHWTRDVPCGGLVVMGRGYCADLGASERAEFATAVSDLAESSLGKSRLLEAVVILVHNGVSKDVASADFPGEAFYTPEFFSPLAQLGVPYLVVAGHWHKAKVIDVQVGTTTVPEELGSSIAASSGSLLQAGALVQHNWGDAGQPRGWWDIELPSGPTDSWELRFTNSGAPRFIVAHSAEEAAQARPKDFVRIAADAEPAILGALAASGVDVAEVEPPEEDARESRADLRLGDSDDALAAKYVAARYEGDDPDGTLALGRRLLQEVTS